TSRPMTADNATITPRWEATSRNDREDERLGMRASLGGRPGTARFRNSCVTIWRLTSWSSPEGLGRFGTFRPVTDPTETLKFRYVGGPALPEPRCIKWGLHQ